MISKVRIKSLIKESISGDMISDMAGDLAMQFVGGFDIADWTILIPAMIKNLREIRKGTTRVEEEMIKFANAPSKHRESLRDAADDIVTDTVDLGQRMVEALPGSWFGSATSFLGGNVVATAFLNATAVQKLGEEFSELVDNMPEAITSKIESKDSVGLSSVTTGLVRAGEALNLIEVYEDYVTNYNENELAEQEEGTEGGGVSTGVSDSGGKGASTWESGVQRGSGNPVGPTHWADSYTLTRGKANPLT